MGGPWRTKSGHAPIPLLADCAEKVLATVGANFLRAAGELTAVGHDGSHQLEQNPSTTFFFASRTRSQKKSASGKL
jgi:hypothetical protein